jgi:hypothetical protein
MSTRLLLLLLLLGAVVPLAFAIIAVDTSLATVPTGYYGGIAQHRGDANVEMLSKARLVIVEKWEGHCWKDCMAGGPSSAACQAACGVENAILDTMGRWVGSTALTLVDSISVCSIKALNPGVATVLYWNTLLAFPFYTAVGKFAAAGALTIDSVTGMPILIENDAGMQVGRCGCACALAPLNLYTRTHTPPTPTPSQRVKSCCARPSPKGISVYGFDTHNGVQLYIDTVKNLTSTGLVDGFFGDKWGHGAAPNETHGADPDQWLICNGPAGGQCGSVTAAQGARWNAGKKEALAAATAYVGDGPYYCEGHGGVFEGVSANLNGHYINWGPLQSGDPRAMLPDVKAHLKNHLYMYMSCTHDQSWSKDPNDPAVIASKCSNDTLARFLLVVEKGCFLGTNGWDQAYERPLGDPLGPAVYTPAGPASAGPPTLLAAAAAGAPGVAPTPARARPATLRRNFTSGTSVVFTYNSAGTDGTGEVLWSSG